ELARLVRSGFHEGSHYGALVITGPDGTVRHAVGDVHAPMFPRSSNKPFQAVAMLEAGAALDGPDLALAAASHAGEPMHTERVLAVLAAGGFDESDLQCPEDLPLHPPTRLAVQATGEGPARRFMN